jgi:hypothetical protein
MYVPGHTTGGAVAKLLRKPPISKLGWEPWRLSFAGDLHQFSIVFVPKGFFSESESCFKTRVVLSDQNISLYKSIIDEYFVYVFWFNVHIHNYRYITRLGDILRARQIHHVFRREYWGVLNHWDDRLSRITGTIISIREARTSIIVYKTFCSVINISSQEN